MRLSLTFTMIMTLVSACQPAQTKNSEIFQDDMNIAFRRIKAAPSALREFLWQMPKGGDIHHHMLGSVPAEDYLHLAIVKGLWVNPDTYHLYFDHTDALAQKDDKAIPVSELIELNPEAKEEMIDHWSVRNHRENGREGHHWFFSTFQKFEAALIGNEPWLLSRICEAAAEENLQYLETMVAVPSILQRVAALTREKEWAPDISLKDHLEEWFQYLIDQDIDQWAQYNSEVFDHWMRSTNNHGVELRFQTVGLRVLPDQAAVFAHLLLAFKTAQISENLVGVNFVAPEDNEVSLSNYNTHMGMFRFLKTKYPEVNLTLHAGELSLGKGDASEKDLSFHIDHAINIAGAQRIGHGTDILQETDSAKTLQIMKRKDIAVEVNLESNQVILETGPETHPLKALLEAGVPVCISSDDAAILRSDLTHQYELLVRYIPEITYTEIKALVFNSIEHSFLNQEDKTNMLRKVEQAFGSFENSVLEKR